MSLAVGPLGRTAEASGSLNSSGKTAAMFSYSKSKGLYGGISVEGTILVERSDANAKAYTRAGIHAASSGSSKVILSGNIEVPEFALPLIDTIQRLTRQGGAIGAGLDGDFAGMGIGGEDSSQYSEEGRASEELDEYGYPVHSKASRRVKGRPSQDWDADDAPRMRRQWSDQDRAQKRENETRNVGGYAFSGVNASDSSNPFADSVAAVGSRRRASSSAKSFGATDYGSAGADDPIYDNGRPSHTRSRGSKGSFSLSNLRGNRKTPPPSTTFAGYDPEGTYPTTSAYDASPARTAPRKASFPTQFNDSSSENDDPPVRTRAHSKSPGPTLLSTINDVDRRSLSNSSEFSFEEGVGQQRERERYLDDFDRELQQSPANTRKAPPASSRNRSNTTTSNTSTGTSRPSLVSRLSNTDITGKQRASPTASRNSFRPGSAAGGRRSTTPTWARNLSFDAGGRGSAGAHRGEQNDPFYATYDTNDHHAGIAAARRKIAS